MSRRENYTKNGIIKKKKGMEWRTVASTNVSMTRVCQPDCNDGEELEVGCVFGEDEGNPLKTTTTVTVIGNVDYEYRIAKINIQTISEQTSMTLFNSMKTL